MAETIMLKAETRDSVGSKHAKQLRRKGMLPAIIYGHQQEPLPVALNLHDFTESLHHGHRIFDVKLGKKKETLLVKDIQYDHLGKYVIHADLVRVDLTEMVKVTVPIEQRGTSKGSHESGMIDELLDHLEIECRVSDIPDVLPISVKEVGVGDSVHARDVELPEGAKLVTDPNALVLHCHLITKVKTTEELEEEMPAAPEVISEKPEEEQAEQEEAK
jgi:large subunit ribosomal protein L25